MKFTKAELLYIANVLAKDLSPSDNSTMLEMVELRHILSHSKNSVSAAIASGDLFKVKVPPNKPDKRIEQEQPKKNPVPTITELRKDFPNLSDKEIIDIIEKVRAEQKALTQTKIPQETVEQPPLESFATKTQQWIEPTTPTTDKKRMKDIENAQKFASLLSSV